MNRTQRAHLNVAALSHAGRSGKNNEDRYAVASFTTDEGHPAVFAVVADGIGGLIDNCGDEIREGPFMQTAEEIRSNIDRISGANATMNSVLDNITL